jgi:hypothetical protein
MSKESFLKSLQLQIPALLCLQHLYSEYSSMKSDKDFKISDDDETFIENLYKNRETTSPTWHDLYRFELILANLIPIGKLRGKVVRLRYDYRSVAGQKEFDDYMSAKPPDLQSPPDPADPPDRQVNYEKLVREDLKDLLDRLYIRYAILPVKEKKLNKLTAIAAGLCLLSLLALLGIAAYLFACPIGGKCFSSDAVENISSLTIFVVVVTGAMGGFVSALQRIQTQPVEGDSVYNLSLLFYGSYSVFVAPITGAIFAILLYLMFTSQVLSGTFFPVIYTPPAETTQTGETSRNKNKPDAAPPTDEELQHAAAAEATTSLAPPKANANVNAKANANTNVNANANVNANQGQPNPTASPTSFRYNFQSSNTNTNTNTNTAATPKPKQTAMPTVTPVPAPEKSLKIVEFLANSGPAGGKDYALLILWCFIAGFAERFVPDALDRFISKNKSGDGSKT